MAREPMRVGKDSTEPVNPETGLTFTETVWWNTTVHDATELNKLLKERGSLVRFRIVREP